MLQLPPVFTDNLVLQQGRRIRIWGQAPPGQRVRATFRRDRDELAVQTTADDRGQWQCELPPLSAGWAAAELVLASGPQRTVLSNVLVGEVWLFSGQSNAAMRVENCDDAAATAAAAELPGIRVYVSNPNDNGQSRWTVSSADTVLTFPAVAFYFARALSRDRRVPVGVIVCAKGGTMLQTWVSRDALAAHPAFSESILAAFANETTPAALAEAMGEDWPAALREAGGDPAAAASQAASFAATEPAGNYEQFGLPQLTPYAIRGIGWYQGESNAWGFDIAERYQQELRLLIDDWRRLRDDPALPVLVVQLPHYPQLVRPTQPPELTPWALVMTAQWQIQQDLPQVHTAVAIDLGLHNDIHPRNKAPVGERLSLLARRRVHAEDLVAQGPSLAEATFADGVARLRFRDVAEGLTARDVPGTAAAADCLEGFLIAGSDRWFQPAVAVIEGRDTVICRHEMVAAPVAVRYAMHENCLFNLYNSAGLPAPALRTDRWPSDTPPRPLPEAVALRQQLGPPITGLTLYDTHRPALHQTTARFQWDDRVLQMSCACHQSEAPKAAATDSHDLALWSDDNVQLLLAPGRGPTTYVRIVVNAAGVVAVGDGRNDCRTAGRLLHQGLLKYRRDFGLRPDHGCVADSGTIAGGWAVTLTVPWSQLGLPAPSAGDSIGMQLTRTHDAHGERSEWATTGRDYNTGAMMSHLHQHGQRLYHSPGRFGVLRLQ